MLALMLAFKPVSASAASADKKYCMLDSEVNRIQSDDSQKQAQNRKIKIGKYYFWFTDYHHSDDKLSTCCLRYSKKKTGKGKIVIKDMPFSGSTYSYNGYTNGKYFYYYSSSEKLMKVNIKTKKVTRLKKAEKYGELTHVYGNNVYLYNSKANKLFAYNTKTKKAKKVKAFKKVKGNVRYVCGKNKYIYAFSDTQKNVYGYRYDVKKGKMKRVMKKSYAFVDGYEAYGYDVYYGAAPRKEILGYRYNFLNNKVKKY